MDDREIAARLAAERADTDERIASLVRQVESLADEQALATHDDEHDPEGVTIAVQRAQIQGLLAGARRDLDALERAADRLRHGAYGSCWVCGAAIPAERLEALPTAETCVGCTSPARRRR